MAEYELIDFAQQPASTQWEMRTSPHDSRLACWVWYKPDGFPQGLAVRTPDDLPRDDPQLLTALTMRSVLATVGLDSSHIFSWTVQGMPFEAQGGHNPLLDQPLPPPVAGLDPAIYVTVYAPQMIAPGEPHAAIAQVTQAVTGQQAVSGLNRPASAAELELLQSMETEWSSSIAMENDLARHRKMLTDMLGKLKTLNRDLNTDERTYSSSQDKKDWQDARRWLRDCSASLTRCLKEYDIGFTSKAGQRTWFEQTYEQHVVPMVPFQGMNQAHADYQIYHKSLQTLLATMKTGLQYAAQNGERRAQRILTAIAAKVRQGGKNQSFLGVVTGN